MQNRSRCGFVVAVSRRHGIICPVGECEPVSYTHLMPAGTRITAYIIGELGCMTVAGLTL